MLATPPDADTFALVAAAAALRRRYFGTTVKVNYLVSLKTGLCPEDCSYCSQRLGSTAEVLKYSWLDTAEAVRQAGWASPVVPRGCAWSPPAPAPRIGMSPGSARWSMS